MCTLTIPLQAARGKAARRQEPLKHAKVKQVDTLDPQQITCQSSLLWRRKGATWGTSANSTRFGDESQTAVCRGLGHIIGSGSPIGIVWVSASRDMPVPWTYKAGSHEADRTKATIIDYYKSTTRVDHQVSHVRGTATEPRLCSTSMQSNLASSSPRRKVKPSKIHEQRDSSTTREYSFADIMLPSPYLPSGRRT